MLMVISSAFLWGVPILNQRTRRKLGIDSALTQWNQPAHRLVTRSLKERQRWLLARPVWPGLWGGQDA
jgi:hypothetical protein